MRLPEARWRPGLDVPPFHSEIFAPATEASGAGLALAHGALTSLGEGDGEGTRHVLTLLRRLGIKRLGELAGVSGVSGTGDDPEREAAARDALRRRFRSHRSPAANPLLRLELALWRVDGEVLLRRIELAAATREASHITRLFAARLDDVEAGFGIEAVQLRASWSEPLALSEADLDAAAEHHGTALAACIDRLSVRLGPKAVTRPILRASHIPGRS